MSKKKTLLIVDDNQQTCAMYTDCVRSSYASYSACDMTHALRLFTEQRPSVVLLDYHFPHTNALEFLREFQQRDASVPIIVMTGTQDIRIAVHAIKHGAYDFLHKPIEPNELLISLDRAFEHFCLKHRLDSLDSAFHASSEWILGHSHNATTLMREIQEVAKTNFSILLEGETGTGKSFLAHLIHQFSQRAHKAFIKVDIGAIPESLIEKELFGSEKGAYTGAEKRHTGYFELAHEGTLFIDELENMTPLIQSKLLTVFEDKKLSAVGSTQKRDCNFRLICATNQNIHHSIQNKAFRSDLFYRLAEYIIRVDPLRKRGEDTLMFAKRFLAEANDELNKHIQGFSDVAMQSLMSHSWPGNIRELKTVIRKAALLSQGKEITHQDLRFFTPADSSSPSHHTTMKSFVEEAEIKAITQALKLTNGNKSKSAKFLEISYKTLLTKMHDYHLGA